MLVLAACLVVGVVAAAQADSVVAFSDANLRAAVAGQLVELGQIPAGSDGTTVTPSDMEALTALSAPNRGIVGIEGLEHAVNLTTLDLSNNHIAKIESLSDLPNLTELDVSHNEIDVTAGSDSGDAITELTARAHVTYRPQHVRLSQPTVSPAATLGASVAFSAGISPRGAAESSTCVLTLYHLETKTVTKTVKGKHTKVRVNYWRVRSVLTMQPCESAGVSVRDRLLYAGKWQAQVAYLGTDDYAACTSTVGAFVVHDPRIELAIAWAKRQLRRHTWDRKCLKFVGDAYERGARTTVQRFDHASQAARALHASLHRSLNAPRGAYVFYVSLHGRTNLGHVGISLGDGTMINDYGSRGVKIMPIKISLHYVGWAVPPLTPAITDWNLPTAP